MTTKISPDDLLEAIESLKPAQDRITHSWYIGRREHTLQQVLTRATTADDPAAKNAKKAPPVRAPKRRGRAILAGAVAVAMLGGGAAWAYTTYASWYTAGALGGLTCMTAWAEPGDAAHADQQYGGPPLTTDPVADCDSYAETTGKRTPDADFIRRQPFAWKPPGIVMVVVDTPSHELLTRLSPDEMGAVGAGTDPFERGPGRKRDRTCGQHGQNNDRQTGTVACHPHANLHFNIKPCRLHHTAEVATRKELAWCEWHGGSKSA